MYFEVDSIRRWSLPDSWKGSWPGTVKGHGDSFTGRPKEGPPNGEGSQDGKGTHTVVEAWREEYNGYRQNDLSGT